MPLSTLSEIVRSALCSDSLVVSTGPLFALTVVVESILAARKPPPWVVMRHVGAAVALVKRGRMDVWGEGILVVIIIVFL